MKKPFYIVFIALFLAACLIPSVGLLIAGPSDAAANEVPHILPSVKSYDGSWNMDYLDGIRDYVGYGFFQRLELITAWDTIEADVFRTSANDDIIIGPDGWLFYCEAADDMSGANRMTDRELWCCARSVYLMQEYAESQGAAFVFAVPCGKYTLYPEHAPSYTVVNEEGNLESLVPLLQEQGVNYADLYEAFTAQDEILYWQWDSHWNARGAALAADTILAAAGRESDWFGAEFTAQEDHVGDLYEMLYPTGTDLEVDYTPVEPFTFEYTSSFHSTDDIMITTTCADAEGSLLIFRDSSGRNLYPYLAESFGSAYISRLNNYRLDYIAEQQADVVVVELAQRTLDYLLQYPAVYPAPERDASVLDTAEQADSELSIDTSGTTLAGCMQVTGTLPETETDECVYLSAGGTVYEAIPNEGSFTAWLPIDTDPASITVYTGK